jgi:hypothetical protein
MSVRAKGNDRAIWRSQIALFVGVCLLEDTSLPLVHEPESRATKWGRMYMWGRRPDSGPPDLDSGVC